MDKVVPFEKKDAWTPNTTPDNDDEGIGNLWTNFSQNTGFHGVNKLTPGNHYRLRCLWWSIAVMGMTAYMTYSVTKELMNYYTYPTVTSMKVEQVDELELPAITICNLSPFSKWHVYAIAPEMMEYFNRTSLMSYTMGEIDFEKEFLGDTFRKPQPDEWWKSLSMSPEKMYYTCLLGHEVSAPCKVRFSATYDGFCGTYNFNVSDVKKVNLPGSDYSIQLYVSVLEDEYIIRQHSSTGVKVLLHDQRVHPDAATTSFMASPGSSSYGVIKKSTFKYLPPPFKAFSNKTCVDTHSPDFNNTLEFYDTYTYEHCILECISKTVFEKCGCGAVYSHESLEPRCSVAEFSTCYHPSVAWLRRNNTFLSSECKCQMPCSFDKYEVKLSTSKYPSIVFEDLIQMIWPTPVPEGYMGRNNLELRIYFEELMVQSTEQLPQYTTETIIGNLGGQMGICLGASILTLTELGEFFMIVLFTCFRRFTKAGRK